MEVNELVEMLWALMHLNVMSTQKLTELAEHAVLFARGKLEPHHIALLVFNMA